MQNQNLLQTDLPAPAFNTAHSNEPIKAPQFRAEPSNEDDYENF